MLYTKAVCTKKESLLSCQVTNTKLSWIELIQLLVSTEKI